MIRKEFIRKLLLLQCQLADTSKSVSEILTEIEDEKEQEDGKLDQESKKLENDHIGHNSGITTDSPSDTGGT
jgi:hypothetical protein